MIPRSLQLVAGVSFALGLAFYVGRLSRPGDDETPAALVAARAESDSLRSLRIADSSALKRAQARTDSAAAVAAKLSAIARQAARVTAAYRDTVRILNDSAIAITGATGDLDTMAVPAAFTARLRADSATIAAQAVSIDTLHRALELSRFERDTSWRAIGSATAEAASLRRQIPLERDAAYARGKRDGRRQGIVIGSLGAFAIVFTGVKVVRAVR